MSLRVVPDDAVVDLISGRMLGYVLPPLNTHKTNYMYIKQPEFFDLA